MLRIQASPAVYVFVYGYTRRPRGGNENLIDACRMLDVVRKRERTHVGMQILDRSKRCRYS